MEIERKFLLRDSLILDILAKNNIEAKASEITQFYTSIDPEIRYRKQDEEYFLTHKSPATNGGLIREEHEFLASKLEYKTAKKEKITRAIKKRRYEFQIEKNRYFLDIYHGFLSSLFTLEVEFDSANDAINFQIPVIFSEIDFVEVTDDKRYKNLNLSLFGSVDENFDIKRACRVHIKDENLVFQIPAYLDSYDAILAILRVHFLRILKYKELYEKSGSEENLHDFRVNLRKSRSLLQLNKALFDKDSVSGILSLLKTLANSTNPKRESDVFRKFLDENDKNLADKLIKKESDKFTIDGEIFSKFSQNYAAFLADEDKFFAASNYEKNIKIFIAKVLIKHIKNLKKALKNLNEDSKNESFHTIRIKLKKLRYLCEIFAFSFDLKPLKKMAQKSKIMQEIFGNLQDRCHWHDVFSTHKDSGDLELALSVATLDLKIIKEIFELRDEILDSKEKFIKILNKNLKYLKAYKGL